jgi:hypothetical protein
LVDQSAENGLPADPVRRGWQRDDVRAVIGGAQAHVVPLVAATSYDLTEDISVTAYGSGMTLVEGTPYGISAYLRKVIQNPLLKVRVDPETEPEIAPQYPYTPRGSAAQRTWMFRLQDTPAGRQAARAEAALLWTEAGLPPPELAAPGAYVS